MKKADLYLVIIVLFVALSATAAMFIFVPKTEGAYVIVSIGGEETARYPLHKDLVEEINTGANGEKSNVLEIKNGTAQITFADCPDKVCVQHVPISSTNEHIVCLPNKLMIEITGATDEAEELDYIAK